MFGSFFDPSLYLFCIYVKEAEDLLKTTSFQMTLRETSGRTLEYRQVLFVCQENTPEVIRTAAANRQEK